jgi:hypothetical protein
MAFGDWNQIFPKATHMAFFDGKRRYLTDAKERAASNSNSCMSLHRPS